MDGMPVLLPFKIYLCMSHNTLKICKESVSDSHDVQVTFKSFSKSSRCVLCPCLTSKDHFRYEGAYCKNGTRRDGIEPDWTGRDWTGRDRTIIRVSYYKKGFEESDFYTSERV